MSKKGMIFIIIVLVLTLVLSSSLWAAPKTYYCDPSAGSNGNNGLTPETAWASLQSAWDTKLRTAQVVKSGDTVKLMNGYNGHIDESQRFTGTDYLTIEPADGHTGSLATFKIDGGEYWQLKNLIISPEADGTWNNVGPLVRFIDHGTWGTAHDNIIDGCLIYNRWDPTDWDEEDMYNNCGYGIHLCAEDSIIRNCTLRFTAEAIVAHDHRMLISNNTITRFVIDGIHYGWGNDTTIEYNTIQGYIHYTESGAHHDGIQMAPQTIAINNLTIRGNYICAYLPNHPYPKSSLQGIFKGSDDYQHSGWSIVNNVVLADSFHGISCKHLIDGEVVNNTVVKCYGGVSSDPQIYIVDNVSNVDIINNIAHVWNSPGGGSIISNNYDIDDYTETDEFTDFTNHDVHLKSTSNFVNVGTTTQAPSIDLDQNPRDLSPDVGAYEYQGKYFIAIKE